jgi:hypothetical protein
MGQKSYPIYRKFKNGKEFRKVNSENESISVIVSKNYTTITHSNNSLRVADALDDQISEPSTRDEWEKVYGETQWKHAKANQVQ